MIERDEIDAMAAELGIHTSNVQRDYVFGWLIAGLYQESSLGDDLVLKGGNALRKGYLPLTRFSDDLDFSTPGGLDGARLIAEFNRICRFAEARSGVHFDVDRNRVVDVHRVDDDPDRSIYKLALYFRDFAGEASQIVLKVRVDVAEYDRLILPVQTRNLIHQYSDASECQGEIACVKLEEALADKLRCLLQRRYSFDLFDLVYATFVNNDLAVDRSEVVSTFLKKTVFEGQPVAARRSLLAVPLELMRGFWNRIVAPAVSLFSFERAVELLTDGLGSLFPEPALAGAGLGRPSIGARGAMFYPADARRAILQAGSGLRLLELTYSGVTRLVEPYALVFKRRRDGIAREYFYGWDLTGGRSSGAGIKSFFPEKIQSLAVTETPFEPRFEVELGKLGGAGYFGDDFAAQRRGGRRPSPYRASATAGPQYVIQCNYCGKRFPRTTLSTSLRKHKDPYGNDCYGRIGHRIQ